MVHQLAAKEKEGKRIKKGKPIKEGKPIKKEDFRNKLYIIFIIIIYK